MSPTPLPSRSRLVPALLLGLAAIATLGGCATRTDPDATGSIDQDGYRQRHPIIVEEGEETLDLPVGIDVAHLTPRMARTVESFGRAALERRASGITILVPSGSTNEVAARNAAAEVSAALQRAGLPAHAITRRPYGALGAQDAAPIRLTYPRVVARVAHPCGQWPDQVVGSFAGFDNGSYWNFGCATQANLAAEVAEPTDLISPAEIGPADTTRAVNVIDKYRKGQKTKSDFGLASTKTSSSGGD
ncbi:pilus assembly protein CpaD [Siculibacillus lacustris]|uniref:Pilus assembly protein CpaD n=1 Tax=Siculibacillus lacustris TaxID=1549641 RepID=A0A4Q9VU82_9HYPH|nr:CpaD family pilus assembly protein [Siculibacillus lacustris]TBW39224.1 pilus assembly protein CpaD [Siculibacillus lacustris]